MRKLNNGMKIEGLKLNKRLQKLGIDFTGK